MVNYNNYIRLNKLDNSINMNIIRTNFKDTIKLNFYLLKRKLYELLYCQNSIDITDIDYNKIMHIKRIGNNVYFTFFVGKNKEYNADYLYFVLSYKDLRSFFRSSNNTITLKDISNNNIGTGKIILNEYSNKIIRNIKENKLVLRQFKKAIMNLNYNYSYDVQLYSDYDNFSFSFSKYIPGTNKFSYNGALILSYYNNKHTYSIHT